MSFDKFDQTDSQDLSYFLPAKPVRSDLEAMRHIEMNQGIDMSEPGHDIQKCSVNIVYEKHLNIPKQLKVFAPQKGDITSKLECSQDISGQNGN